MPPVASLVRRHLLLAGAALGLGSALPRAFAQPRPLMQAQAWQPGLPVAAFWVSEKLDGMRGYWDGARLWSRGGHAIAAPAWFTQGWPHEPMDGELWAGRGRFAQAVSTARRQQPDDEAWRQLRFMAFDLPAHGDPFDVRWPALHALAGSAGSAWLQAVAQTRLATPEALQARLQAVVAEGGEGLMLHHGQALYRGERSEGLRKLKLFDDAEGRVVGHLPGQGRHAGRLGALLVELPADGPHGVRRFRLGTGLSDAEREAPPPIGAVVSFRHQGFTPSGLPRFASYWRLRPDE